MSRSTGAYEGLRGKILQCQDCRRATIHLSAQHGLPICAICGACYVAQQPKLEIGARPYRLPHVRARLKA